MAMHPSVPTTLLVNQPYKLQELQSDVRTLLEKLQALTPEVALQMKEEAHLTDKEYNVCQWVLFISSACIH